MNEDPSIEIEVTREVTAREVVVVNVPLHTMGYTGGDVTETQKARAAEAALNFVRGAVEAGQPVGWKMEIAARSRELSAALYDPIPF